MTIVRGDDRSAGLYGLAVYDLRGHVAAGDGHPERRRIDRPGGAVLWERAYHTAKSESQEELAKIMVRVNLSGERAWPSGRGTAHRARRH